MVKTVQKYELTGYDALVGEVWSCPVRAERESGVRNECMKQPQARENQRNYDTPEEWWYGQEQFYGRKVPTFRG